MECPVKRRPLEAFLEYLRFWIIVILLGVETLLAIGHLTVTRSTPGVLSPDLIDLFHMDREGNLPTWFSTSQLLRLALVLLSTAVLQIYRRINQNAALIWTLCAGGALFLSADEGASIHEMLGTLVGRIAEEAEPDSLLHRVSFFPSYYWLLLYVPMATPIAIFLIRFFWRELHNGRVLATTGLIVYLIGAVALDFLEGSYGNSEHHRLMLVVLDHAITFDPFLIEELMEMVGVTLVLAAFLKYLLVLDNPASAT